MISHISLEISLLGDATRKRKRLSITGNNDANISGVHSIWIFDAFVIKEAVFDPDRGIPQLPYGEDFPDTSGGLTMDTFITEQENN
jgi:hypothetical protein